MTVPELLQISGGYWQSCALHAGVKLDLCTLLDETPRDAAQLARELQVDVRGLAMLLNAFAAMDLLLRDETGSYTPTPFAARFLSKRSGSYMGHIIMHHHHLVDAWGRLDEAVRTGAPVRRRSSHDVDALERESFLMGMFNLASLQAPQIAASLDLGGRRRLLDLAGGPGTYAIHFCMANPDLAAVVYDLPTTRPFAEETVKRCGLSDRITFCAGDIITDDIGNGYDVVWVSHLLHSEGPATAAAITAKAAAALAPGGMLLIQEFILEDSRTSPLFPALFSLNMLVGTPTGQAYSQGELKKMMADAGLTDIRRLGIELPNGAGIMAGTG